MARSAGELSRADFDRYFPFTPTALAIKECARLTVLRRHEWQCWLAAILCRGLVVRVDQHQRPLFARL